MKTLQELEKEFKECYCCKVYKKFAEFTIQKDRSDGLCDYCRDCNNKRQSESRRIIKQDPLRYKERLRKDRDYDKIRRSNPDFKRPHNTQLDEKYRETNREQRKARRKLAYHLKRGYVIKYPCAICGEERTEGHHEDYSKPLKVIWLCIAHHAEIHRKFNTIREQLGLK